MTHPYSIYIWQPNKQGGKWIEPLQAYSQEYALYIANLIHQDTKSVIKVVRYGLHVSCFPDEKTVERIDKYLERQGHDQRNLL